MSAATLPFCTLEEQLHSRIGAELAYIRKQLQKLNPLLARLQPINSWEAVMTKDKEGIRYGGQTIKFYTRDMTTGDFYRDDPNSILRVKLLLLSVFTPTVNLTSLIVHSAIRLIKLVTLYEFFNPKNSWSTAVKKYALDLVRLVCGPLILVCMQITAMLGTITPMKDGPKDARKIYSLGETMLFGHNGWRLARCFEGKPKENYTGFDIEKKSRKEDDAEFKKRQEERSQHSHRRTMQA